MARRVADSPPAGRVTIWDRRVGDTVRYPPDVPVARLAGKGNPQGGAAKAAGKGRTWVSKKEKQEPPSPAAEVTESVTKKKRKKKRVWKGAKQQ